MHEYNDVVLKDLIIAGKDATLELSAMKFKKQTLQKKQLLAFRRSQLNLIRKRATELNLTESEFDDIRIYVQANSI